MSSFRMLVVVLIAFQSLVLNRAVGLETIPGTEATDHLLADSQITISQATPDFSFDSLPNEQRGNLVLDTEILAHTDADSLGAQTEYASSLDTPDAKPESPYRSLVILVVVVGLLTGGLACLQMSRQKPSAPILRNVTTVG